MVITIDGPAGVGKSTVSSYLAQKLGILLLKSGSFYRALSLALKDQLEALPVSKLEKVYEAQGIEWQALWHDIQAVEICQEGEQILLGGVDVSSQLQTPALDALTPLVSKLPPIRHFINDLLRRQAEGRSLIAEGRDMGTVVFPNADHKFFLDASTQVRAQRRWNQFPPVEQNTVSLKELEQQIQVRDRIDRNKKEGALRAAENACIVDTTSLTFEAVCLIIIGSLTSI